MAVDLRENMAYEKKKRSLLSQMGAKNSSGAQKTLGIYLADVQTPK